MAFEAGTIIARLGLDTKSFDRNIGRLDRAGKKLSRNVSLPIAAAGLVVTKLAADFESSFAGVRKTVDATEAQFEKLSQGFRDMAKEIPVNVNELNRVGEAAGQLGIKTENILDFTRTMADLGVATNLSAEQAATSLARLANITGLPQDQFDRLGSTIVALGNNFATTEAEIVEMGLRIAGAGEQIGLAEGQILAISTALSSVGISAEAGGTAISKVMINMASAVSSGGESLQQFASVAGMSGQDFARVFRDDAAAAINSFVVGLGDMQASGGDVLGTLAAMGIEEVRMRDALLRAASSGDLLTRALDLQANAWSKNTALTKEAEQRYKTFSSQLTIFGNRLRDIGITLGTSLLPVFRDALDAAQPLVDLMEKAANKFADLPKPVRLVTVGLASVAAAAGPVLLALKSMAASFRPLLTGLSKFAGGLGKFFAPIARATSMLGLRGGLAMALRLVGSFITGPVGLAIMIASLAVSIGKLLHSIGKLLLKFEPFRNLVVAVGRALQALVQESIAWVTDAFRKLAQKGIAWVSDGFRKLLDWISPVTDHASVLAAGAILGYNNHIFSGILTSNDTVSNFLDTWINTFRYPLFWTDQLKIAVGTLWYGVRDIYPSAVIRQDERDVIGISVETIGEDRRSALVVDYLMNGATGSFTEALSLKNKALPYNVSTSLQYTYGAGRRV